MRQDCFCHEEVSSGFKDSSRYISPSFLRTKFLGKPKSALECGVGVLYNTIYTLGCSVTETVGTITASRPLDTRGTFGSTSQIG